MCVYLLEKAKTAGKFPLLIAFPFQLNDCFSAYWRFFFAFLYNALSAFGFVDSQKKRPLRGRFGYELNQSRTIF